MGTLSRALMCVVLAGCALEHEASARFVDGRLREQTRPMVAERAGRDAIVVGSWTVRDVDVTRLRNADPGRFGLEPEDAPRPGHTYALGFVVEGPHGRWTGACEGRRARPAAADYAAVLDEAHDEVAVRCEIRGGHGDEGPTEVWYVETGGTLRQNVRGRVTTEGRKGAYEVEILTRYRLFTLVRRSTPIGLGQVRTGEGARAAMTLARPEHVWIGERDHADAGLWLAILVAHRYLPLGWND